MANAALSSNVLKTSLQRIALLGMGLLIIAIIYAAFDWKLSSRVTSQIEVAITKIDGNQYIIEEDVIKIVKEKAEQPMDNISIGRLNVPVIEQKLRENPFVENADAYLDARGQLHVAIIQRRPVIRIIDQKQRQYYLDKAGNYMPLSPHATARVMVATGNIPTYYDGYLADKKGILYQLYQLQDFIRSDEFLVSLTEQIYINEEEDFIIIPKIGNHEIIVGDGNELDDKFARLKIFYKEGLPYKGWNEYKTINLKFKNQVVGGRS